MTGANRDFRLELPVLFNDEMTRSIIAGTKTQTRRPLRVQPPEHVGRLRRSAVDSREWIDARGSDFSALCPFGSHGDRLWVRECFARIDPRHGIGGFVYRATNPDAAAYPGFPKWTPSIHMPRHAARIVLDVVAVRVERLHDITEADATAEGITGPHNVGYLAYRIPGDSKPRYSSAVAAFETLWSATYSPDSWNANPLVWVVEFRRVSEPRTQPRKTPTHADPF